MARVGVAVVDIGLAIDALKARGAIAGVAVDPVDARSSVDAGVSGAVIDVGFAIGAGVSGCAGTGVAVDAIVAGPTVLAGVGVTIVDVGFAAVAGKTVGALTGGAIDSVDAEAVVFAACRGAVVSIHRAVNALESRRAGTAVAPAAKVIAGASVLARVRRASCLGGFAVGPDEPCRAVADAAIDLIDAGAIVLTRIGVALVLVDLAIAS